jgi:hypothetical protein
MTQIEYQDRPPAAWFVLDVMRKEWRSWDYVALMIDVHPDDFKDYRRMAQHRWVRIPGKHRNKDAAWEALENIIAHAALSCRSGGRSHRAGLAAFGAIFH